RRTVRRWAQWGRPGLILVRRPRPRRPGRLVVLWDVSGSMAEFFELYVPWLYTLVQRLPQAGVFPFGHDVVDATSALRRPYPQVYAELQHLARVWSGGTRIGAALHTWLARYGPQWLGVQTTVLVLSDGWDTGPPQLVADALRTLRARDAAVWWLHPLLTTPGFAPKTRTLQAAAPYLLGLLPGDTPAALLALAGL
ncbi:MAG: VWA domain-containing protein, partial [Alicyclobacillus sp.]|nr:VWA domain-containing protein [Alicyclobacillus sp.]